MHTPSPTMLIDELAYLLDMSVEDVLRRRHAWVRYKGFPKPIRLNRTGNTVYVRREIEAWLHTRATQDGDRQAGTVGPLDADSLAEDAAEASRRDVLDDLKAYAQGRS